MLKKILLATTASALLATAATPAMAQSDSSDAVETGIGISAGATTGAITGGILGGPIGAVIGGFAGATLGAAATVPEPVANYAVANPVEPVYFDTEVSIGSQVGTDVTLYDVPDNPGYAYFYANGRAYIVDRNAMEVVYSPGYTIPQETITYVSANPTTSVNYSAGDFSLGIQLPSEVQLAQVPNDPQYSYVYYQDRPVLVETDSRTVVWIAS